MRPPSRVGTPGMAARLRGRPLAAVVPIGIGHNNGPPMATRWGVHCWRRAQARAWQPPGPEVVRLRLRRAAELGLDYRQLASILMEAGRSPTAIVFTLEALAMPGAAARLRGLDRPKLLAVGIAGEGVGGADQAPPPAGLHGCRLAPDRGGLAPAIVALLAAHAVPPSAAILVGTAEADRDLMVRARLAAFLPADAYFGRASDTPSKGPSR